MPEQIQQPVDAAVRHERRDARLWMVAAFAVTLIVGAVASHLALYWMLAGLERRQRAVETRGVQLPQIARESQRHFPAQLEVIRKQYGSPPLQVADIDDMNRQRAAEDAILKSYGWSDKAKGTVRIPIDDALQLIQDPAIAKAHGIIARDTKEAK